MKKFDLIENNSLSTFLKFILYFGISLYPIYIFGSGLIQIGHFLLLIFSIIVLIKIGIPINRYFYTFLIFLAYCYLVSIYYLFYDLYVFKEIRLDISVFKNPSIKYLKELLFLTYNFILTLSIISFFNNQKKSNLVSYALVTAILIILYAVLTNVLLSKSTFRFAGYFNNPNQLGYFSICCFSLIYLLYRNLYINYFSMIICFIVLISFSILTLSKAAYISLFLCSVFAIKPFNLKYSKILETAYFLSLICVLIIFSQKIMDMWFFERILNITKESDSSFAHRGYNIFFESNYLQSLFGIGLKNMYTIHTYEIHSTFGMILTCYGLAGFLIFFALMLFWILDIKNSYGFRGVICVCGPSLLYGLTHNGIRFSMFWILFAISISLCRELNRQKNFKDI
tara:strand:+ start:232 stop:1422 length:1191 start_codon:yes stop_codon:yes gene_type:complete